MSLKSVISGKIRQIGQRIADKLRGFRFSGSGHSLTGLKTKLSGKGIAVALSVLSHPFHCVWHSLEYSSPRFFRSGKMQRFQASANGQQVVTGYTTTATLHRLADTLLTKRGGLSSQRCDAAWCVPGQYAELGAGCVDPGSGYGARALRKDMSRSQSQSREDPDLAIAEPQFNFDSKS